ncbi:hypothetical protein H4R18_004986 [Coemansia javaensis]|uniref:Uncharacterized protein n=1 Tax=Coemansia javaensis TaxID=2761396 RepID=A0A9W8LE17_9FUNG|nr:hypothetical protein H4R18_004986 [Coemansia javaensis]
MLEGHSIALECLSAGKSAYYEPKKDRVAYHEGTAVVELGKGPTVDDLISKMAARSADRLIRGNPRKCSLYVGSSEFPYGRGMSLKTACMAAKSGNLVLKVRGSTKPFKITVKHAGRIVNFTASFCQFDSLARVFEYCRAKHKLDMTKAKGYMCNNVPRKKEEVLMSIVSGGSIDITTW